MDKNLDLLRTELSVSATIAEFPRIDVSGKVDHSDLLNKFIIIPDDIFTVNFNVLLIDDTFILRNIVCYIFKTFFEKYSIKK